jgi:PhnB protein
MSRTSTYLNFAHQTEEAFLFYRQVFGSEFTAPGFRRFSDMPPMEGMPPMPEHLGRCVMHVELPITGGHLLMGTDAPPEMGFTVTTGNNIHLNLEPDTRAEADRLFAALAEGGTITQPLGEMFWGAYFGSCTDKFGIGWMVNTHSKT